MTFIASEQTARDIQAMAKATGAQGVDCKVHLGEEFTAQQKEQLKKLANVHDIDHWLDSLNISFIEDLLAHPQVLEYIKAPFR